MRIIALGSPKSSVASAFAVSVFPTPVGPRKRKEPIGRFGSLSQALFLSIDSESRSIELS